MVNATASSGTVRIVIADGAELVRRGIRDVLGQDGKLSIVGEIARLQDVPQACEQLSPDIIFLGGGRGNSIDHNSWTCLVALRQTLRHDPFARIIVLVSGESLEDVLEPVRAGARGVLLRDAPARTVLDAVYDVLDGGSALDPRLAYVLFEHLTFDSRTAATEPRLDTQTLSVLSRREQEVLLALAQGCRNKEIAAALGISVGTVKTHLRHIFRKLKVADRTAAVLTALHVRLAEAA